MEGKPKIVGPRYRAERVTADHLDTVSFRIQVEGQMQPVPLINISKTGVGAYIYQKGLSVHEGEILDCELDLDGQIIATKIEIRYVTSAIFGAQFHEMSDEQNQSISDFFKAEVAGARLKEIPATKFSKEYSDGFHVFMGYDGADGLDAVRFETWGHILEYRSNLPKLRIGHFADYDAESAGRPQVAVFEAVSDEEASGLKQFLSQLVSQIDGLDEEIRSAIVDVLK